MMKHLRNKFNRVVLPCLLAFSLILLSFPGLNSQANASPILAERDIKSNAKDLLYKGNNTTETNNPDIGTKAEATTIEPTPAQPQKFVNPGDFSNNILEKIWQQFVDASAFLDKNNSSTDTTSESNKT